MGPTSVPWSPRPARDRICDWIARAQADGATIAVDGRRAGADADGNFLGPTILDGVTPEMDVAREEVFGPVLAIIRAETLDGAIAAVSRSRFGNGASIFPRSRGARCGASATTCRPAWWA